MKDLSLFLKVLITSFVVAFQSFAEEEIDPSALDPSDIYFDSWMALRDADEYQKKGEFEKAFEATTRSKRLADTITLYHPQWKPHLVQRKLQEATTKLEKIVAKLPADQRGGLPLYQTRGTQKKTSIPPSLTPEEIKQANDIQKELRSLREELRNAQDLRNADVARLQAQVRELIAERDKLAASTLHQEIRELKNRIELVEDEKKVLAKQLYQTQTELKKAGERIAELDAKEKKSRLVANQLNAMLEKQNEVSGNVIEGLRNREKALQTELKETKQLLLVERQQTQRLDRLLTDARGEIETLTTERDHLLKERDHYAELLKLNQGDRIQRLIEQNMTLARNLREAEEAMQNLALNSDAKAEELLEAKRDLAMAKNQIMEQQEENDADLKRRLILEDKLKEAYEELKTREALADVDTDLAEENQILREVAEKLLVTQARRREQVAQLLAEAENKKEDPRWAEALEIVNGDQLTLSPEEQRMLANTNSDGLIRLKSGRNTPEEVRLAKAQLRRLVTALETAIDKSYRRGKIEVSLDLCEQLLEENPAHVPTMINQGIIFLRMGKIEQALESLNNAITINPEPVPYAHYMRGVAYHTMRESEEAEKEYEIALKINPSIPDAHNRLGSIHAQKGEAGQAREHFEMAYRLDNSYLSPLVNLSVLHNKLGEVDAALNYYRKFRQAGGQPRPELERLLAEAEAAAPQEEGQAQASTPILAAPN